MRKIWRQNLQRLMLLMLYAVRSQQIGQLQTHSIPDFGQIGFPVDWHNISLCHAILHYDIRSPDALSADAQIRASAEAYCNSVPFEMLVLQSSDDLADLPLYCSGGRGGMPTVFLDDDDGSSPRHECAASARAHCVGALDAAFAQRLANSMLETTWSKEGGNDGWTIIREAVASVLPVHLVPRLPLPQPDLTFTISANPDLWAPADGDLPRERFGGVDSDSFGASYEDTHASSEGTGNSKESEHSAQKEQQQQQQQQQPQHMQKKLRVFIWPARWRDAFYRERRLLLAGLQRHPGVELIGAQGNDSWWREIFQEAVLGGASLPEVHELENSSANSSKSPDSGAALVHRLAQVRRCSVPAVNEEVSAAGKVEGEAGVTSLDRTNTLNYRNTSGPRCFVGGNILLKEWLKADLVIFLVDEGPYHRLNEAQERFLALIDPRGLVPRSRLVVIDYRDTPTKRPRSTPGLRAAADLAEWQTALSAEARAAATKAWTSARAMADADASTSTDGFLHAGASDDDDKGAAPRAKTAAEAAAVAAWVAPNNSYSTPANFMLEENCVLYLERAWQSRENGAFVPPCSIDFASEGGRYDDGDNENLNDSENTNGVSSTPANVKSTMASEVASMVATRAAKEAVRAWAARADPMRCPDPAQQTWFPWWNTSVNVYSTSREHPIIAPHRPVDFSITDEMLPGYHAKNRDTEQEWLLDDVLTSALPDVSVLMKALHSGIPMVSELQDPVHQVALKNAAALANAGADPIDVAAAIWHAERPLKLVCLLRPSSSQSHCCRVRALKWAASLCASRGLKGRECFTGQWSDALRDTFDQSYFNVLRRAQVVVTQKPCDYEGDYRTWEVLAAGAVLVVDAPARGFGGGSGRLNQKSNSSAPKGDTISSRGSGGAFSGGADGAATPSSSSGMSSSLVHGEHAVFFDATNRESFDRVVNGLLDATPRRRYLLARHGHRLALEKHRAVSRVDAILNAVVETWEHWPQKDLAEVLISPGQSQDL